MTDFKRVFIDTSPVIYYLESNALYVDLIIDVRRISFMVVTATECTANFGKYLKLIDTEDVFITQNGKTVAKVVNPHVSAVDSLRGILKEFVTDIDMDSLREERLLKYEDNV